MKQCAGDSSESRKCLNLSSSSPLTHQLYGRAGWEDEGRGWGSEDGEALSSVHCSAF